MIHGTTGESRRLLCFLLCSKEVSAGTLVPWDTHVGDSGAIGFRAESKVISLPPFQIQFQHRLSLGCRGDQT